MEKFKEDLLNILEGIICFIIVIWVFSFFGLMFAIDCMIEYQKNKNPIYLIFAILIVAFDLILLFYNLYKRYFTNGKTK